MQQICEIISTKSSRITIHENLDPQNFSAIRYIPGIQELHNCSYIQLFSGSLQHVKASNINHCDNLKWLHTIQAVQTRNEAMLHTITL